MNNQKPFIAPYFICATILLLLFSCAEKPIRNDVESSVKVALRAVGNDLLLSQNDTTSLVLPIKQESAMSYRLNFEDSIAFDPGNLHAAVITNFNKLALPKNYRFEVFKCFEDEVVYSFEMQEVTTNSVTPCGGRILAKECYTALLTFTEPIQKETTSKSLFYLLVFLVIGFLVLVFYSKYYSFKRDDSLENSFLIGSYRFYPEQNKLVKEAEEISLSKKECELLSILTAHPNEVVKREELTKRVWEDNGVIVGRSLDTYISKLRKKLKDDESLKITNIHGVGYKLELDV